jgi:adenylate cyclase
MFKLSRKKRRLVAIMFTDIVGYSALTQKNENQALKLLEEHNKILRDIFSLYGGKEIKTIGDAFLVEFESALKAVKCAIKIQQSLYDRNETVAEHHKIRIRIGIHIGDVIHRGGDLFGDEVNITARIEPLASPGGICISEQVYYQVKNKIKHHIESMGEQKLKNIQAPMELFKIHLMR